MLFRSLKIAEIFKERLDLSEIIWPISSNYSYLSKYIQNEKIKFYDQKSIFSFKNFSNCERIVYTPEILALPLRYAHRYCAGSSLMESKYVFLGLDHEGWANHFEIKRDYHREQNLIKYLNIDFSKPYNLINLNFNGISEAQKYDKEIKITNDYDNIYMNFLGFDRIFDWIPILENAKEIHTVNTALVYLVENLKFNSKLFMYNRNASSFSSVYSKKMYVQQWNYINYD